MTVTRSQGEPAPHKTQLRPMPTDVDDNKNHNPTVLQDLIDSRFQQLEGRELAKVNVRQIVRWYVKGMNTAGRL